MSHYTRYYLAPGTTNANLSAAHLRTTGPTIPVEITVPAVLAQVLVKSGKTVAPVAGFALIDTGASSTVVDETVIQSLGVNPVSKRQVGTPGGTTLMNVYPAQIAFPATGLPAISFNSVIASPHLLKVQKLLALIGRDILQHGSLYYNGDGHISISLKNTFTIT
jgi:predicted aspartyl protease